MQLPEMQLSRPWQASPCAVKRYLVLTVLLVTGALLLAGCEKAEQKKKAPKITLLTPPAPPPPPPPPKFEKKPEPPKQQKEMKVDQPVERKVEPQAAPELKMDGPAGNGPSAFGAGNITSEDLSKVGSGKAGGTEKLGMFNPFNSYASAIKGELQRYLGKNNALRRRRYSVDVYVWLDGSGKIKRYEVIGTSNDGDTDEALRSAIAALPGFSEPMPASMPQPVRLRIVTGG